MATRSRKTASSSPARRASASPKRAAAASLPTVKLRMGARTEYRIYPSIGIARVGDCADSFFIGPEAPGVVPTGPFRGADHGLKPQAARFRIYKVEIDANETETVTEEIKAGAGVEITWSVNLANRKAAGFKIEETLARSKTPHRRNHDMDRDKLVIAANGSVSGTKTKGPTLSGAIEFAKPGKPGAKVTDIVLATLRTDEAGRLLVVGGPGKSGSPLNAAIDLFSDNDGWYDSVSDGPVSATLRIRGQAQTVIPAWVVVTVPRFAPGIYGVVTWYDQAVSMARTGNDGRFSEPRSTSFTRDIYPILKRADNLSAVHDGVHGNDSIPTLSDAERIASFSDRHKRAAVQARLTPINTEAPSFEKLAAGTMPQLFSGANPDPDPKGPIFTFPALTKYQMAHINNWARGNFQDDWPGHAPTPKPFDQIPVASQAWALCEAALEACVGAPFYPGIEGTYDIARAEAYHPRVHLRREFRINPAHPAGFLTEKMALPWQADFADCQGSWWPSQRPDDVTTKAGKKVSWDRGIGEKTANVHLSMVESWSQLGFVVSDQAGKFVEDERTLDGDVA
jgi:L-Lysine epsilon oxidase N-terminal/L-lysine epsilon oxidase C-terminal domain